ncbi:MAG: hypothetical protein RRA92_06840 [Gemmatimonadota bacterium]|nr:hypothetical protein [Gemmatimonadota bacterium]
MLAAAFFMTVIVALAAHHVLIERPRRAADREAGRRTRAGPAPLRDVMGALPGGVFLQDEFTWSRVTPDGDVDVGIHPLLLGLVGGHARLDLETPESRVEKGRPFARIGMNGRSLAVRAPVSGRIRARNPYAPVDGSWESARERDGGWLYRIEPDDLASEIPTWMIGQAAADWSRERYGRVREYLQRAVAGGETGLALADGGEVPVGALAELDPEAWRSFETEFLAD